MHRQDVDAVESRLVAVITDQFPNGSWALRFMIDLEEFEENALKFQHEKCAQLYHGGEEVQMRVCKTHAGK